jgi:hypothetical protein
MFERAVLSLVDVGTVSADLRARYTFLALACLAAVLVRHSVHAFRVRRGRHARAGKSLELTRYTHTQSLRSRRLDRLFWTALLLICTLQALDPDRDAGLRLAIVLLLYVPVPLVALIAAARWRVQSKAAPSAVTFVSEDVVEEVEAVEVVPEGAGEQAPEQS